MNTMEFDAVLGERHQDHKDRLQGKAKEYAREDRLSNFKASAGLQRCSPEKALFGMLAKHLVSLSDLINDTAAIPKGPMAYTWENLPLCLNWKVWDEKLGDAGAYLILLDALVRERLGVHPKTTSVSEMVANLPSERTRPGQDFVGKLNETAEAASLQ